MARHEGGVQGYAEALRLFHRKLVALRRNEGKLAHEGEHLDRRSEEFERSRENVFRPHAEALAAIMNELTSTTLLFSHWQAEKRYFDRRPIQRFFIRRLIKQVATKAAEAVDRYRKIEKVVFGLQ